jgi:hypothetical protein
MFVGKSIKITSYFIHGIPKIAGEPVVIPSHDPNVTFLFTFLH